MTSWTAGYVAEINYTFGYYSELSPLTAAFALASAGLALPKTARACELGFGQGMSLAIHAAGSATEWWGTDFNPAQAHFAQSIVETSGAKAHAFDLAFHEFATRSDLPEFDFIGLHGIWSWISDENRGVIAEFLRKRLAVGGVAYISYNTLPGWAGFAPMRHLMTQHAEILGAPGRGVVNRIDGAIEFAERLLATNPGYARMTPTLGDRLNRVKGQNRHYLAHEYFNRDWHPMHFATMTEFLEEAKLQFAASATLLDHIDAINLTAEQQAFLNDIPDSSFRQSVRDFMVNQQFRKDYWVKGARMLSPLERIEALREFRFILSTNAADVPLKVNGALGEANLSEAIYKPLIALLADYAIHSLAQLEQKLGPKGISFAQVLQAVTMLLGAGHVQLAQADSVISQAKKATTRLNQTLMQKSRSSNEIGFLASPVTGGGVAVGRFPQLFLLARQLGHKQPADWAQFVWNTLAMQGQRLIRDGSTLETAEENLAELNNQAQPFNEKMLPILKALQIA
ncbi:methyltransferase regulatory domain-containing protein [Rhabdaerophilum sp. SD176]|uniref:methyltransferase regulatory domain-containing protein n=1 Tax=Rhabdaerophilum sp. SD176 TaxID=2983548 RepID=UPI0024E02556|nr:methyltransferase regulatory domain-containing protein [Rhabdaerophilum sp. SD176]